MELKELMDWLAVFPGFQGMRWETDCLPHEPGMATLTSKGVEVLDTIEDVMGNWKKTMKLTCTLSFSGLNQAQTMVDLQHWVEKQDALGGLPRLGNGKRRISLSQGRHLNKNKLGLSLYTAQLAMTYEIYYEVNENGEN